MPKMQAVNARDDMLSAIRRFFGMLWRLGSGAFEMSNSSYERQVKQVNEHHREIASLSDEVLKQRFAAIRHRVNAGVPLDRVLVEVYAIVKEIVRRTLDITPYDVQLLAACALFDRKLIEMQTGEGKTIAAVFPAILRALSKRGVHVLTFNDYLAARDAEWMGPIYRFLGIHVGHIVQGMTIPQRQAGYAADITYVTAKEAGFDFLRDQICMETVELVHREFHCAIIDEADSILIDEARVPLVIAGPHLEEPTDLYRMAELVRGLRHGVDFTTDNGWRNVQLSSFGADKVQRILNCGELYSEKNTNLLTRVNLALQAQVLLQRNIDYLVREGAIELIDEFTGRVAENRRWPYGLQAAIEAKEGVAIQPQGRILNSVTLQNFLSQYTHVCGMTGTAQEASEELHEFYQLKTVLIPPHRPCIRRDRPDRVFPTKSAKHHALVQEITRLNRAGSAVLVGTASVEESEIIAARLSERGLDCRVLNAQNDRNEAATIAEAGRWRAITISTNMAGRGTDIRLGGKDERDRDRVAAAGGLHVIGTNRHESRRIDNQLRGRAGRQGDPGETAFFVSIEDDLIRRHGIGELIMELGDTTTEREYNNPKVGSLIAHVQRVIEGENFDIRRTLRLYSNGLEQQRRTIQRRRGRLLTGTESPKLLGERDPILRQELVDRFGETAVEAAERKITIWHIDRCWADHLAEASAIRDQIYLLSMAGMNPLDEFHRMITRAFAETSQRIEQEVISTFRSIPPSADGIELLHQKLAKPSSTWTYMVNDNPLGNFMERISRSLKQALQGLLKKRS